MLEIHSLQVLDTEHLNVVAIGSRPQTSKEHMESHKFLRGRLATALFGPYGCTGFGFKAETVH